MIKRLIRKICRRINNVEAAISTISRERDQLIDRLQNIRSPALSNGPDDLLTDRLMSHPVREMPGLRISSSPAVELPNRIAVAERLLQAYNKAIKDSTSSPLDDKQEDMWSDIQQHGLSELFESVESNDAEKLANYLMGFGSSFVWFGGISTSIDGYNKNQDPHHIALTYWDKLLRLAEYLGVLPMENPENGPWGEALQNDPGAVIRKIEDTTGISIFSPDGIIHKDGIDTGSGLLHYRNINSIYAALRINNLLELSEQPKVCEIGGGIGLTAMYSRRLGINDYTIYDLPITCLLSGHYLLHACGEDNVTLYGETETAETIKVYPYWKITDAPGKSFDLVINQDGFNEIADEIREAYSEQIARISNRYFLSINHEYFYPRTVSELLKEKSVYRRIYRSPYWVREGYVEELFELTS